MGLSIGGLGVPESLRPTEIEASPGGSEPALKLNKRIGTLNPKLEPVDTFSTTLADPGSPLLNLIVCYSTVDYGIS